MKQTLALKYRPQKLGDVVGQEAIKRILGNQIKNKTHKHAYLFTGSAGTGKTSVSRIFANDVNNGQGNPIEIDAASNNGIEDVRQIIEDAQRKSLDSDYKVYIIDECHSLSSQGWQAMLKLIEEPPGGTIFIFCTTDPQKIPATILSRVQRYDFQRISYDGILARLEYIMEEEGRKHDGKSLSFIAKMVDGGLRDAITLLDQCLAYADELILENVLKVLGTVDYDIMFRLLGYILGKDSRQTVYTVDYIHNQGVNIKQFCKDFAWFLVDVLKYKLLNSFDVIKLPEIYKDDLDEIDTDDYGLILNIAEDLNQFNADIRWENNPKSAFEMFMLVKCGGDYFGWTGKFTPGN